MYRNDKDKTISLEDKAKTFSEIREKYIADFPKKEFLEDLPQKWVPLEVAEELEREKSTAENLRRIAYEIRDGFLEVNNRLSERIVEANKILDEITGIPDPHSFRKYHCWRQECPSDCSKCTTFRLREVLQK